MRGIRQQHGHANDIDNEAYVRYEVSKSMTVIGYIVELNEDYATWPYKIQFLRLDPS